MKIKWVEVLDVYIYTDDSEAAKHHNIMASPTVFINDEWVHLDIASSQEKLGEFLKKIF